MRKELAKIVFPLFRKGLQLRERLERGEQIDLVRVRKDFCLELKRLPNQLEWVGDGEHFLGIRYALACWLDDLFILDLAPVALACSDEWRENAVEWELYETRLRGVRFWEQEGLARQLDPDVLEVFYLCVLLGFRGDKRDRPAQLREWRQATEDVLNAARPASWPDRPPDRPVEWGVPPLLARQRLLRAMLLLGGLLGLLVATVTFCLGYLLGK